MRASMMSTFRDAVSIVIVMAGMSLPGCGGGGGSQCGGSSTCGGNVVGNWNISDVCIQSTAGMVSGSCPQLQIDAAGLRETGTVAFQSDRTYASTATVSGSLTEVIPTSCLTGQGVTADCAQLNALLMTFVQSDMTFSSASCTSATGGCACTFQVAPQTNTESGTYSTSGAILTTQPSNGAASTASYCVQGSTMTVADMNMTGMSGVTAELVLNRR